MSLWAQPTVVGWLVLLWTWRVSARRLYKVVDEVAKIEQKVKKGPFLITVRQEAL